MLLPSYSRFPSVPSVPLWPTLLGSLGSLGRHFLTSLSAWPHACHRRYVWHETPGTGTTLPARPNSRTKPFPFCCYKRLIAENYGFLRNKPKLVVLRPQKLAAWLCLPEAGPAIPTHYSPHPLSPSTSSGHGFQPCRNGLVESNFLTAVGRRAAKRSDIPPS